MAEKDMDDTEDKEMLLDEECDCGGDESECDCDKGLNEESDSNEKDDEEMNEADDEDDEDKEKAMYESLAKILGLKSASSVKKLAEAVNATVALKLEAKEKRVTAQLRKEALEAVRIISRKLNENMESKLNAYSKIVVKEWVKENTVAINSQIEVSRAKRLMEGLRKVLSENNVEVPEDEKDIVDDLEDSLADAKYENVSLAKTNAKDCKMLESYAKKEAIAGYGLSKEASDKIYSIVESFPVDVNLVSRIKTIVDLTESSRPAKVAARPLTEKTQKPLAQKLTESFQPQKQTKDELNEFDFIRSLLK